MRKMSLLRKCTIALYVSLGVVAVAQGAGLAANRVNGPVAHAADTQDAQILLKKIQAAAQRLNYTGIFVYQQGNLVRTSRITHLLEGRNEYEKLEVLDGKPREYVRTNEEIVCYVPETRSMLVEKRVTKDVFPAIISASPIDLAQHYNIKKGESDRIAGYDCESVVLQPKDGLRYGYKLWADKATGLLLRVQTLDDDNEVVEQIAFTHVGIGNINRRQVRPSYTDTSNWHIENAVMKPVDLSDWTVKLLPPGFTRIQELRRMISDIPAHGTDGSTRINAQPTQREVLQIVFSDGLAAVSVFIEPGTKSRTEGSLQQGATSIIGKRFGDYWLTFVGEVPASALRKIANSIQYKGKQ